ncbi:MAG: hypothetical protein AB7D92_11890 [Sphaerochaeta sp.]
MKKMLKSMLFVSSMALSAWLGIVAVVVLNIVWGVWEMSHGTK